MAHKFNPLNKHRLDSTERRQKFPPEQILNKVGISKGDTVADIGCGVGFFSIPAAEMVGKKGLVYAVDTSKELLSDVESKIKGWMNVKTVVSDEYDFKLDKRSVDVVFISFVLHEIIDKDTFLGKVRDVLKSGGKLSVIEWVKEDTSLGPVVKDRIAKVQTVSLLKHSGFKNLRSFSLTQEAYLVNAVK